MSSCGESFGVGFWFCQVDADEWGWRGGRGAAAESLGAARNARGWDRFLSSLPQDMTAILEQVRTGELGVDFRVHDADGVADRLVDGLIASASLIASAQLLSRKAGPTVGGLSVAGLVAAGVGAATWQRLAAQRQGHQSAVSRARRLAGMRRA